MGERNGRKKQWKGREKAKEQRQRERGNGLSFVVVFCVCLGKVVSRLCCREGSFFCVLRNIGSKMRLGFGWVFLVKPTWLRSGNKTILFY